MVPSCMQLLIKVVVFMVGMIGIASFLYGLWMFSGWQPHLGPDSNPNSPAHCGTMKSRPQNSLPTCRSSAAATMDIRNSIRNQTDISFLLAKRVISSLPSDATMVFSPVSINLVLGLIASGSKGPALDELLSFLRSKAVGELHSLSSQLNSLACADGGPRLTFTNGVFVDQSLSLKPTFNETVGNAYKASISHLDFQTKAFEATKEVNLWAEKQTNGLIKEIIPSGLVNSSTRLILANAVYFKGEWDQKFDASNTRDGEFLLLNGSSVQVPFISSNNMQYIRSFGDFKVLRLPYKQGGDEQRKFSMYFFLPDTVDGLPAIVDKVCSQSGFLDRHIPYRKVEVGSFLFPKFKISFELGVSDVLKGLGVLMPFRPGGLTEIVEDAAAVSGENYVSEIIHKSFVEVNEEGTEAAAATAAVAVGSALGVVELDFVANHPFLFVVREDATGVVLFIGQVHCPIN